jgi:hypothetical protein
MAKPRLFGHQLAYYLLISSVLLVTTFFWSSLNDPFNAPKSWVLSIAGAWLLGWVIFQIKPQSTNKTLKITSILVGASFLSLLVAWIATDNKLIGFFGQYQRRNGLLSDVALLSILLSAAYLLRSDRMKFLEKSIIASGIISGIYGFAQHFKHDFIQWKNPFNPVITTLGNPDFAAAVMAIFLVFNFGLAIQKTQKIGMRFFAGINVVLLITDIIFSQVRQGLLAAALGITIIIIIFLHQKSKKIAYGITLISTLAGVIGLVGMLNSGPLARYFYKPSVTYRGDY